MTSENQNNHAPPFTELESGFCRASELESGFCRAPELESGFCRAPEL